MLRGQQCTFLDLVSLNIFVWHVFHLRGLLIKIGSHNLNSHELAHSAAQLINRLEHQLVIIVVNTKSNNFCVPQKS